MTVCLTGIVSILAPLPPAAPLLIMSPFPPAAAVPASPIPPAALPAFPMMELAPPALLLLPLGTGTEVVMMGLRMPIAGGAAAWVALRVGELKTFVIVIGFIVVGDPIGMRGLPMFILGEPMWAVLREAAEAAAGTRDLGVPVADAETAEVDATVGDGIACPTADDADADAGVDEVIVFGI